MNLAEVAKWLRGIHETQHEPDIYAVDLKAMAEACERFTWRPMETAPRDRTVIMLADASGGVQMGYWNGHSWDDGDFHDDMGEMTHWMPLPEPPK